MRIRSVLISAGKPLLASLAIAFILLTVFLLIAWQYPQLADFDQAASAYIQSCRSDWLTLLMTFITHLGSAAVTIAISLSLLLSTRLHYSKFRVEARVLALCLSGSWLTNEALKAFFQRARPENPALVAVSGYSFPSGHAMISFAFYGLLGYLLWRNGRHSVYTWRLLAVCAWLLAVTIGVSRIYLGVHFASDVIAGYAAGGVWLTGCIMALYVIHHYQSPQP